MQASAFPVVTGELIDQGGFAEVIAVVASCSALAAIMSTADSCIIGANNVITVDWVKNHLWKSASDKQIQRFSKVWQLRRRTHASTEIPDPLPIVILP